MRYILLLVTLFVSLFSCRMVHYFDDTTKKTDDNKVVVPEIKSNLTLKINGTSYPYKSTYNQSDYDGTVDIDIVNNSAADITVTNLYLSNSYFTCNLVPQTPPYFPMIIPAAGTVSFPAKLDNTNPASQLKFSTILMDTAGDTVTPYVVYMGSGAYTDPPLNCSVEINSTVLNNANNYTCTITKNDTALSTYGITINNTDTSSNLIISSLYFERGTKGYFGFATTPAGTIPPINNAAGTITFTPKSPTTGNTNFNGTYWTYLVCNFTRDSRSYSREYRLEITYTAGYDPELKMTLFNNTSGGSVDLPPFSEFDLGNKAINSTTNYTLRITNNTADPITLNQANFNYGSSSYNTDFSVISGAIPSLTSIPALGTHDFNFTYKPAYGGRKFAIFYMVKSGSTSSLLYNYCTMLYSYVPHAALNGVLVYDTSTSKLLYDDQSIYLTGTKTIRIENKESFPITIEARGINSSYALFNGITASDITISAGSSQDITIGASITNTYYDLLITGSGRSLCYRFEFGL